MAIASRVCRSDNGYTLIVLLAWGIIYGYSLLGSLEQLGPGCHVGAAATSFLCLFETLMTHPCISAQQVPVLQ